MWFYFRLNMKQHTCNLIWVVNKIMSSRRQLHNTFSLEIKTRKYFKIFKPSIRWWIISERFSVERKKKRWNEAFCGKDFLFQIFWSKKVFYLLFVSRKSWTCANIFLASTEDASVKGKKKMKLLFRNFVSFHPMIPRKKKIIAGFSCCLNNLFVSW